ncbi:MAG: hypothetical protein AAF376_16490 [Pseudomonadota bacterium]
MLRQILRLLERCGPSPAGSAKDFYEPMMAPVLRDPQLQRTLESTAACLNEAGVAWMVFGGAALVLHGHFENAVKDIDIIVTEADASTLAKSFSWENYADRQSSRFRSNYLLRPNFGRVPVEIMGGFCVRTETGWTAILPNEMQPIRIGSQIAYLPPKNRLVEILRLCGRREDLIRAEALSRL